MMRSGSTRELPKPVWPHFNDAEQLDPETVMEMTAATEAAVEPTPDGKGYQYTAAAKQRMKELGLCSDGDDNRQT